MSLEMDLTVFSCTTSSSSVPKFEISLVLNLVGVFGIGMISAPAIAIAGVWRYNKVWRRLFGCGIARCSKVFHLLLVVMYGTDFVVHLGFVVFILRRVAGYSWYARFEIWCFILMSSSVDSVAPFLSRACVESYPNHYKASHSVCDGICALDYRWNCSELSYSCGIWIFVQCWLLAWFFLFAFYI